MPDRSYQPSKAELGEEFDMPGASLEIACSVFFLSIVNETGDQK